MQPDYTKARWFLVLLIARRSLDQDSNLITDYVGPYLNLQLSSDVGVSVATGRLRPLAIKLRGLNPLAGDVPSFIPS